MCHSAVAGQRRRLTGANPGLDSHNGPEPHAVICSALKSYGSKLNFALIETAEFDGAPVPRDVNHIYGDATGEPMAAYW